MRLDAAVDGVRLHLARTGSVDVHTSVHGHRAHLAIDAGCCDAAVDGAQIEGDTRGDVQLVIDARVVVEAEEEEAVMFVAPADGQSVAIQLGGEVAEVFHAVLRLTAASDRCIHRDLVARAGFDVDRTVDLTPLDVADRAGRPLAVDVRDPPLHYGATSGEKKSRRK